MLLQSKIGQLFRSENNAQLFQNSIYIALFYVLRNPFVLGTLKNIKNIDIIFLQMLELIQNPGKPVKISFPFSC
jgi:hypothetical protein